MQKQISMADFEDLERLIVRYSSAEQYALMPERDEKKWQDRMSDFRLASRKMWDKFYEMKGKVNG